MCDFLSVCGMLVCSFVCLCVIVFAFMFVFGFVRSLE